MCPVDLELDLVVFLNRCKKSSQLDFLEKDIKLTDLKGKNNINTINYKTGLYFININSKNHTKTYKLIKY